MARTGKNPRESGNRTDGEGGGGEGGEGQKDRQTETVRDRDRVIETETERTTTTTTTTTATTTTTRTSNSLIGDPNLRTVGQRPVVTVRVVPTDQRDVKPGLQGWLVKTGERLPSIGRFHLGCGEVPVTVMAMLVMTLTIIIAMISPLITDEVVCNWEVVMTERRYLI